MIRNTVLVLAFGVALQLGCTNKGPVDPTDPTRPLTCDAGCPTGYTCDQGVCTGGDPTALVLAPTTVPLSGVLTADGMAPSGFGCTGDQVRIDLDSGAPRKSLFDPVLGASFKALVPCSATDGGFATRVQPGTYRVTAYQYDSSSSFPDATMVVDPAFHLTAPESGLAWAVDTVPISGRLTVDGVAPSGAGCSGDQVRIDLTNDDGAAYKALISCATSDGSFTARVAPGTYRVTAYQYDSSSSFPDATMVIDPAFQVEGPTSNLAWDLTTVPLSGTLTVDGQAPSGLGCSGDQVRIDLTNDDGAAYKALIPCAASDGTFTTRVAPGTYRVTAYQYDSSSSFPDATFVADPAFQVTGATSDVRWDLTTVPLSGTLTVDGLAPDGGGCSGDQVRIDLTDQNGAAFKALLPCAGSDGSFTTRVAPGTYRVTAYQYDSSSSFPDATFVADPTFHVTGGTNDVRWDLTTVSISGTLTVDGLTPDGGGCSGDQVRIDLLSPQGGAFKALIPCASSDGRFTARVQPGNYAVTAYQYDSSSSFPDATLLLVDRLAIR